MGNEQIARRVRPAGSDSGRCYSSRPGTPGEGWGGGSFEGRHSAKPPPYPPEYRGREEAPCSYEYQGERQTSAMTRLGPPEAPAILGAPTMMVAPLGGSWARLATFSRPHLL